MIAVIIDQHDSRHQPDRVNHLLSALQVDGAVLGFERTAGDEVQALFTDPLAAVRSCMTAARDAHWSVGVGVGSAKTPLPASTREAGGEVYVTAREAVELAKRERDVRFALKASPKDPDVERLCTQSQALIRLLCAQVAGRSDAEWRVIDTMESVPGTSMKAVAQTLGISRQAVSKSLIRSAWRTVAEAIPAAATMLAFLDAVVAGGQKLPYIADEGRA